MNNFKIDKISKQDLNDIFEIEQRSYLYPWKLENLLSEIDQPFSFSFKLSMEQDLVGYCFSVLIFENLQINNICIDKKYQKKGLGFLLLNGVINQARVEGAGIVTLEVNSNNLAALKLYEKVGFKKGRIKNRFYSNGDNAQTMILQF